MTQNYKPAYPPEFRQQMVELVALGKSPKQLSKEFGIDQIMTIYRTSDGTYGRPRITVELADLGIRVNHKRVGRLMREAGIKWVSLLLRFCDHDAPEQA